MRNNLLVTECLRLSGLAEPLLLPDIDTDISDPIESQPIVLYAFVSCSTHDTSASDDPVSVDTGLVFTDANELHDCAGTVVRVTLFTLRRFVFCKKKPKRTCSSSSECLDLPLIGIGLTLPPSSSVIEFRMKEINFIVYMIFKIAKIACM